jgi:mersacidin/lichenicidin family type 2 lantibiotic
MPKQGHDKEDAMSRREQIIRAWKDPEYRAGLSAAERAELPESPAGPSVGELEESQLGHAVGGGGPGFSSPIRCRTLDLGLCGPIGSVKIAVCPISIALPLELA